MDKATGVRGDIARQVAVATALAGTIALNGLANGLPLNGQTTGEISNRFPLKITPPGYVFAIWGLIYGGLLGYVIYQALPAQRTNPRLRRMAWPFVLSCAANVAWLLLWHYNYYKLTLGAMIGLLLSLIVVDSRLNRDEPAPLAERLLVRAPFGIYLGWISLATLINASVALLDTGWDGAPLSDEAWTTALLGAGTALASTMALTRRDVTFPLVGAWAFAGIASREAGTPLVGPSAIGATAIAVVAAASAALLRRRT